MLCPMCQVEMKLVPAGISKTSGKAYKAFYSCPECKQTMNAELKVEQSIQKTTAGQGIRSLANNNDERAKTMVLAYAKDLVVAMMTSGITPPDPAAEVLSIYRKFMVEIEK